MLHVQLTINPTCEITPVSPSWTLKAQAWLIPLWISHSNAQTMLEAIVYPSLGRPHYSDASTCGKYVGGLGAFYLFRCSSGPLGPCYELLLTPGWWTWTEEKSHADRKVHKV